MRLTEEMVIARSKQSDLNNIRRLNLWGSELSDVSIIRKMGCIEVLALSVNNISSLQPFENCHKLQELYLRRNKVADFKELYYLQNLPKLKHLWLDENPCSLAPGINYRAKVLSMLPNLVKLDDKVVTSEDLEMAERLNDDCRADSISPPPSPDISAQQEVMYEQPLPTPTRPQRELQRTPPQTPTTRQSQHNTLPRQQQQHQQQTQQQQQPQQYQQQSSPQREFSCCKLTNSQIASPDENTEPTKSELINSNSNLESPLSSSLQSQDHSASTSNSNTPNPKAENDIAKDKRTSQHYLDQRSPGSDLENIPNADYIERAPPMHPSCSTQSMKEYYQSDRPVHPPANYRHSQTDLTEWDDHQQHQSPQSQQHNNQYQHHQQQHHPPADIYGSTQTINYAPRNSIGSANGQRNGVACRENGEDWEDNRSARIRRSEGRYYESSNTASTPALHHHGYHRRPASRSANLLSATLCLIKELDYSSLEVIEHAVRCRIDELSSD